MFFVQLYPFTKTWVYKCTPLWNAKSAKNLVHKFIQIVDFQSRVDFDVKITEILTKIVNKSI